MGAFSRAHIIFSKLAESSSPRLVPSDLALALNVVTGLPTKRWMPWRRTRHARAVFAAIVAGKTPTAAQKTLAVATLLLTPTIPGRD